jgi:RHS repeat-associated protein
MTKFSQLVARWILPFLLWPCLAVASTGQMTLPGAGGVDAAGQFDYSIPIQVPPGTAGMAPNLSLIYSTRDADGFEGYGWALNGLDVITHCPATQSIDGSRGAVNYNTNDKFCLNGSHLMLQTGSTYGADGSTYYAYITGFAKIIFHNPTGAPSWFEMHLPSGIEEDLGNTSDSQLGISGGSTAREWHVNKIIDKKGNYLTVTYNNDPTNGVVYPKHIDYTGNASVSLTAYNNVQFVYTTTVRGDEVPAYKGGQLTQIPYLLTDIVTYNGPYGGSSTAVSDYKLGYRAGTTTTHSRLTSVTQCDGTGANCLAPTTFDWQGGTGLPTFSTVNPGVTGATGSSLLAGDFTGDGVIDALLTGSCPSGGDIYAGAGVGSATFTSAGFTTVYNYWDPNPPHSESTYSGPACFAGLSPVAGTFDVSWRAGLVSLETYWQSGVSHNSTTLFVSSGATALHQNAMPPSVAVPPMTIYGDFNGDGLTDAYAQTGPSSGRPYFTGLDYDLWAATFSVTGTGTSNTLIPGDFNGDGCTDLLAQGSAAVYFLCSSGAASGSAVNYSGTVYVGDFNGDGNADVLVVNSTSASIYLSTGEDISTTAHTVTGGSSWHSYQVVLGDWNGDGKTDVALIGGPGTAHVIFVSTGTDFSQITTISNSVTVTGQAADWNSDGADDIWLRETSPTAGEQVVAFQFQPEFIKAVHNGIGATTSISYQPLNTNGTYYTRQAYLITADMDGAYYAVSSVGVDDGAGVTAYHTDYSYYSAVFDPTMPPVAGQRGVIPDTFLAFNTITAKDSRTGNPTTVKAYKTSLPLAGLLGSTKVSVGTQLISEVDYTYNTGGVGGSSTPTLAKVVYTRNDLSGAALPTIETDYNSYDAYNNPLTIVTTNQADGSTSTVTNTFTNDTTNWILGELTSTVVENVVGTSDITRHFNYTPDPTTGYNTKTALEHGSTSLEFDTNYYYDSFGNMNEVQESGIDIATRTTQVAYDALGEFQNTVTNPLLQMTTLAFDARFGGETTVTDPNSVSASESYDTLGRPTGLTKRDGTQVVATYNFCAGVNGGTTSCPAPAAYVVTTEPESPSNTQAGAIPTTYYDSLGRVVDQDTQGLDGSDIRAVTAYNADGNTLKTSRPYFVSLGPAHAKYTIFSYDSLHRVTGATYPDSSTQGFCYNGLTTSFTNQDSQIKVTVRNDESQVSSVTDNASGDCNATGITGPTSRYTYDAFGDVLTVKDPSGNTSTYTYDVRGRKTAAAIPDRGGTAYPWSFSYYVDSTLKSQTDANGNVTSQTYDRLQRPLNRTESGFATKVLWDTTNGVGNLMNACNTAACTSAPYNLVPVYDAKTRISTQQIKLDGTFYDYVYTYDDTATGGGMGTGNIASVTYPSGFRADYSYNSYGYLTQITDHGANKTIWQANSADAELHLTQQTQGPAATPIAETANYDPNTGRILAQCASTHAGPCDGNVLGFAYDWDPLGNLNYRQDTYEVYTEHFCYDGMNRLAKSSTTGATCTSGSGSKGLLYSPSGNITKKTDICNTTNCLVYGGGGNAGPHALSSIVGTYNGVTNPTFTYDNDGNMLTGANVSFGVTSFGQPSTITQGTTQMAELTYNAFHQRYKMCVPSCTSATATTDYLADPMTGMYSEKVVSGGTTRWNDYITVPGAGTVAVRINSGGVVLWRYVGVDHLGSVATLTDPQTLTVVERNSYDPWGKRRNADGSDNPACSITSQVSRGFTGQEMLDSVCMVNMNARLLDPSLGRFTSADSIMPNLYGTQDHNRYSYVYDNPLNATDPSGHDGGALCDLWCWVGKYLDPPTYGGWAALDFFSGGSGRGEGGGEGLYIGGLLNGVGTWTATYYDFVDGQVTIRR